MFLHTFIPTPILFKLGPITIYWYGLLMLLAMTVGFFIARSLFKQYKIKLNFFDDLIFYLVIFSIIGARAWHILGELNYYLARPLEMLEIWRGGLAIHGAIFAGALTVYYYAKRKKLNFLILFDIFVPALALGQAIGRWGNYFNQEIYGLPTNSFIGIPINLVNRASGFEHFTFFQPLFLYESLWCLLMFIFLMWLHHLKIKNRISQFPIIKSLSYYTINLPGFIFLNYLILYSLERFFISFIRLDPMLVWLHLRFDQWTSLILIIFSIVIFLNLRKNNIIKI